MRSITKEQSLLLDLVRMLSAQFVLIGHLISFAGYKTFKIQNLGVLVFFVLSGLLITYSTVRKTDYSLRQYIMDRGVRIFLPFLPALLLVFVLDGIVVYTMGAGYEYTKGFSLHNFVGNVLMLQDFPLQKWITSFGSARPFWTVAIEWWIYLFFGVLFFGVIKAPRLSPIMGVILLVLAIVPVYYIGGRGSGLTFAWLFGALVALFSFRDTIPPLHISTRVVRLLGAISIVFFLRSIVLTGMHGYSVGNSLCIALLLMIALRLGYSFKWFFARSWVRKSIEFLTSYSYSLYLIHYSLIAFVLALVPGLVKANSYWWVPALFVACNIVAFCFYLATERNNAQVKSWLQRLLLKIGWT